MQKQNTYKPSEFAHFWYKMQQTIFYGLGGEPKISFHYIVNSFKTFSFLWVILLMVYFDNYKPSMYLYLFLHGTYGIFWVTKDIFFPDQRLHTKGPIGSQIVLFILLVAYWAIPVPLAMGIGLTNPSTLRMTLITLIYITGVVLMMGADYQKYKTLQKRKGLISSGFFYKTRNPNYLGQLLIYTSFCLCAGHVIGFIAFYSLGGFLFAMNIYVKEELSLKKKQGYTEYAKHSNIFFPKLVQNNVLDWVLYTLILAASVYYFCLEFPSTFFYPLTTSSSPL